MRLLQAALLFFALTWCSAQNFQTGDNSTVIGCSSHCSVDDRSHLECWNRTRTFYERLLASFTRHYIAVQVNIDQWHRRHDTPYVQDMAKVKEEANQSFLVEKDGELLTEKVITELVETLIDRVSNVSDRTISWVPHLECPLPCEYRSNTWRNLFIVSMLLNVGLVVAAVPYVVTLSRKDEPLIK